MSGGCRASPWRGCNESSGWLNADYADWADLFRDNQRNQRLVEEKGGTPWRGCNESRS